MKNGRVRSVLLTPGFCARRKNPLTRRREDTKVAMVSFAFFAPSRENWVAGHASAVFILHPSAFILLLSTFILPPRAAVTPGTTY
jgi:hypothetical protein